MFPVHRNSIVRVRTSVCVLVGLCATLGVADLLHAAPGMAWTERFPVNSPAPRFYHTMAYDQDRDVTVLFGGTDGQALFGDTWLWDGTTWALAATDGPSPRHLHAMAYDASRGVVVLYGGRESLGSYVYRDDTWEWDGAEWIQRDPATRPSPRGVHRMAYDSTRRVTVLYGGHPPAECHDETWEWDGTNWTQRNPITHPSARHDFAFGFDELRAETVLFGGRCSGFEGWTDTWTWDGTSWTQQANSGPSPREAIMTCVSSRGKCVLFGGWHYEVYSDTWEWDGSVWAEVFTSGPTPAARAHNSLAYDSLREVVVMFGGWMGGWDSGQHIGAFGDTWEYGQRELLSDCNNNGIPDEQDIDTCDGNAWCGDCNANGLPDECDIEWGNSSDCDFNGIPDECESLPAPERIVFTGRIGASDPRDVLSMAPDGTDLVNHTADFSADVTGGLAVSPDGTRIAFTTGSPNGIWVMNADGTDPQLVRDAGAGGVDTPRWYNNDILFYAYTTSRSCPFSGQIRSITFDGVGWANDALVVANASAIGQNTTETFDISPDRTKLIWDAQRGCWSPTYDIYICDLVGAVCTNARAFFADSGDDNSDVLPKWAADSQTVYWQHWINPGVVVEPIGIAAKAVDSPRPVTEYDQLYRPDLDCGIPLVYPWFLHDVSPDGTRLLFYAGSAYGVYIYDIAGQTCVPVHSADYVRDAVWAHLCINPEPTTPPICDAGGSYAGECQGETTSIPLDGTASYDADGDPLTFAWTTDCPGGFDDPTSPTPILMVDTSPGCSVTCGVTLTVDDGMADTSCPAEVTVGDTLAPVLDVPEDVAITCGQNDGPSRTGMATAVDECDPATGVTYDDLATPTSCPADPVMQSIERTWTATDTCGNVASGVQTISVEKVALFLDIKPGSCPNALNASGAGSDGGKDGGFRAARQFGRDGALPVALVGTEEFDVRLVDLTSLRLSRTDCVGGAVAPVRHAFDDVATPFGGELCDCHTARGDGTTDLTLKFDRADVVRVLHLSDFEPDTTVPLTLSGSLLDGCSFIATDCVWLIPAIRGSRPIAR